MNESDKSDNIIEDEKEGKIEDIIKGLEFFSEYQRDDSFDEKITTSFIKEFKIFTHKFVNKISNYKQKNNYDLEELK